MPRQVPQPDPPSFVRQQGDTLLVPVRVVPRSRRNDLALESDSLRVHLTAPPVEGKANEALIGLLAGCLGVSQRQVRVARGATGRQKVLAVEGLALEVFWQRLHIAVDKGHARTLPT
jgi:uncharacterized protein (TIGR00251 family)